MAGGVGIALQAPALTRRSLLWNALCRNGLFQVGQVSYTGMYSPASVIRARVHHGEEARQAQEAGRRQGQEEGQEEEKVVTLLLGPEFSIQLLEINLPLVFLEMIHQDHRSVDT